MFRKVLYSIALSCALGNLATAQEATQKESAEVTSASGTKAELASYGVNYSNAGYAQTPQAMAYGQTWGGTGGSRDCSRFYHYPYVFYPQNYRGSEYYQSSDSMYNRYPPEMQIPVYNRHWQNFYPSSRRYHWGHHFILDVF